MTREKSERVPVGRASLASIDIGSHTARLLVAQSIGPPELLVPLFRKRVTIRLAEDFHTEGGGTLQPEAMRRTLKSLEDFASLTKGYGVEFTHAVSTGVVREASNKDEFLGREEEAWLTEKGVLHALNRESGPFTIFDLGGGSTEFIYGNRDFRKVKSVPLGAMVLAQKYLTSDPPQRERVEALGKEVDDLLKVSFSKYPHFRKDDPLVGTGGTVTALASMIYAIDREEISPERMNGLVLEREQIEDLFTRIKTMTTDERLELPGLDRGRADVIPAGCMAVIRILRFLESARMVVCLSDLLEGILIAYLQGEEDE
jgi:exopolyphosphatase/guanosine-5'-triphosphate,3'-diphosphate pyrophosphatase